MSTIDSILLLAGSLVVENIYGSFRKELDPKKGLKIARYVTLVIGVLALLVAIKPPAAILWIVTMAFSLNGIRLYFPFSIRTLVARRHQRRRHYSHDWRRDKLRHLVCSRLHEISILFQLDWRHMAGDLWRHGFIGFDTRCEQIHLTHAQRCEGIIL